MVNFHPITLSHGQLSPHRSFSYVNCHPIALFLMVNSHPIALSLMVNLYPIALSHRELLPHRTFSW